MNKDIKKLLLVNIFLAFADGIFYNFLELWLSSNGMSINTISIVLSLAALITVSIIFLSSNIIEEHKLKRFVIILMIVKAVILTILFILYQTNFNILIKFLVMFDYGIDVEICACMYPLIAKINKDDKIYAKRRLLYETVYYIAALISGLLLGKIVLNLNITYNTYAIVASISIIISALILSTVDINKYLTKNKVITNNDILFKLIKKIKNDKISIYYILFIVFNDIAYYSLVGILMTILTKELNLSPLVASNAKLLFCLLAVGLATLILYKLTLKNDYVNISFKYVGRVIFYFIPVIYLNKYTIIIGLIFTILTSSVYIHILDAPYINRFNNNEQLAFSNFTEMVGYFSRSIGTFICGYCLIRGLQYNFLIACIFTIIGATFAYMALYNLNKERSGSK